MNDIANGGQGLLTMAMIVALVIFGLIVWFFVNRASVKASQQVALLEAILDEQKRQNMMLKTLTESVTGKGTVASENEEERDFTRLIPER